MTPASSPPSYAAIQDITGNENLLVLAASPADESLWCGGLIAASCRRGRPPFVMVLGDGTGLHPASNSSTPDQVANQRDRETRAAIRHLGLPDARLLMAGVYAGSIPGGGPGFDAVVRAVTLVMWARDCNVLLAPWPGPDAAPDLRATWRIAAAVAEASGVGLMAYVPGVSLPEGGLRLDITPYLPAKQAALAAHASLPGGAAGTGRYETFLRPH